MPLHLIRIIVPQILGRLLVQFPHRKRYSLNFARLESFTMHQTYSTFLDGMRRWISPLSFFTTLWNGSLKHRNSPVLNQLKWRTDVSRKCISIYMCFKSIESKFIMKWSNHIDFSSNPFQSFWSEMNFTLVNIFYSISINKNQKISTLITIHVCRLLTVT